MPLSILSLSGCRGVFVVVAGYLIHFTLGIGPTYGNLLPYFVSYARNVSHRGPRDLRYTAAAYVYSCQLVGWGISTVIGGLMERRFGPRVVVLLGGFLMSLGSFVSYFAIKFDYWLLIPTFGFAFGVGAGFSFIGPVACAVKWFPKWKGLATGLISAGFASGGVVMPFVQTFFINPHNLKPGQAPYPDSPNEKYFTQPVLLHQIPYVFLIIGGVCALFQLVGSLFLTNPPPPPPEATSPFLSSPSPSQIQSSSIPNSYGTISPPSNDYSPITDESTQSINTDPSDSVSIKPTSVTASSPTRKLSILQVLTKPMFYSLWILFFIAATTRAFIRALYKAFGLEEVANDDLFMTIVLVTGSIASLFARILWGILADTTSYKFAFVLQAAMMTCLLATLYATSAVYKAMYLVWILGINFAIGGYFSVFPVAVAQVFGQDNVSLVYGMIFTGQVVGSVLAAFLSHMLVNVIRWYGVFFILAGFNVAGYVLVMCFPDAKKVVMELNN